MQESLEATIRRLVKEAVKEALLEVRESLESGYTKEHPSHVYKEIDEAAAETNELLVAAPEARKILAISGATLERLTRSGAIPSVKIGRLRRYSVSALKQWIEDAGSTGKSQADVVEAKHANPRSKATQASCVSKEKTKQETAPSFDPSKLPLSHIKDANGHKQSNPFRKMLAEIGVKYSDIHPITNGEIKRIADVDIATCHGWLYLNQPLPADAINRLKKHFLEIAKRRSS